MNILKLISFGLLLSLLSACYPNEETSTSSIENALAEDSSVIETKTSEENLTVEQSTNAQNLFDNKLNTAISNQADNKIVDISLYTEARTYNDTYSYQEIDTSIFAVTNEYKKPVKVISDWSLSYSNFLRDFVFYSYN